MTTRPNASTGARPLGTLVAARLREAIPVLAHAATSELGFPVTFVREQLEYAARELDALDHAGIPRPGEDASAAFLFPSNTEGAMAAYLIALAATHGYRVHAKLSQRSAAIQSGLARVFSGFPVEFHTGGGAAFLDAALTSPATRFIHVFGDDAWIDAYEAPVRSAAKTLAFDGPGKDPFIVLDGADLTKAVRGAVDSGLFAGGAACMSPERFLIQRTVVDEFAEALRQRLVPIRPVAPDSEEAVLGYVYSARAAARLRDQLDEARACGAAVLLSSEIQEVEFRGRPFFACGPVLLTDVPRGVRVLTEETFGPVFPIQVFESLEEAVALADDTKFGLTATVFGPPADTTCLASRLRLSHGIVYVNETMLDGFRPEFWGSGGYKRSGWVWETTQDGRFRARSGFRPVVSELATVTAASLTS